NGQVKKTTSEPAPPKVNVGIGGAPGIGPERVSETPLALRPLKLGIDADAVGAIYIERVCVPRTSMKASTLRPLPAGTPRTMNSPGWATLVPNPAMLP